MSYVTLKLANGDNILAFPVDVKLRSVVVANDAATGTDSTAANAKVDVAVGATNYGTVNVNTKAAGTVSTVVQDATHGRKTIPKNTAIKITAATENDVTFGCTIELDEFLVIK